MMQDQNSFPCPRTPSPPPRRRKSKWQQVLGYEQEHQIAKMMFNSSKLMPPPPKTQRREQRFHKEQVSEYRIKIRSIFRKISYENGVRMYKNHNDGANGKIPCLSQQECQDFIAEYEGEVFRKFNSLVHNTSSLMKDSLYEYMDDALEEIGKWLTNIRITMLKKYQEKAQNKASLSLLQQRYHTYQTYLHQKRLQQQSTKQQDQQQIAFSMKQLQLEISKLMAKEEETNPEEEVEKALKMVEDKKRQRNKNSRERERERVLRQEDQEDEDQDEYGCAYD